jgi:hypothetical protein
MKNIFINLFKNKQIRWLFIALVIILLVGLVFFKGNMEGFDLGSMDPSNAGSSAKPIPQQYQYLAPLPDGYAWSTEMQDKFIAYLKKQDANATIDKTFLTTANPGWGNKTYMQLASEEEVQYYLDNDGVWPWDEYIVNFLTTKNPPLTTAEMTQMRKWSPNRLIYSGSIENQTVPQLKMINDLWNSSSFNQIQGENDNKWYCNFVSNGQQSEDHYGFEVVNSAGETKELTDYATIPDIIKDFSFEGDPCNICNIRSVNLGTGAHTFEDIYNSDQNKCKFKMSGDIPEAYNIYIGKYGNAPAESSPASTDATTSGDEYKKCIASCDTYK